MENHRLYAARRPYPIPPSLDMTNATHSSGFFGDDASETGDVSPTTPMSLTAQKTTLPDTAVAAFQYLPVPALVLSSSKTVIMANDAMARLLSMDSMSLAADEDFQSTEPLLGRTLPELGIDVMEHGRPLWIDWDTFLDSIGKDSKPTSSSGASDTSSGQSTPTRASHTLPQKLTASNLNKTEVHDAAIEVVISPQGLADKSSSKATDATMIVSVWRLEDAKYFTLTFTSPTPRDSSYPTSLRSTRSVKQVSQRTRLANSTTSSLSGSSIDTPKSSGPQDLFHEQPTFPPRGAPTSSSLSNAPSILQKVSRLKDAMLNSINLPCHAVWKDESVGVPNVALLRLTLGAHADLNCDQREFLSRFKVYKEDFSRVLEVDEYPIVRVLKTQQRQHVRFGLIDAENNPRVFDVTGEVIRDEATNEFIGGMVIFKDVSDYVSQIEEQKKLTQSQFEFIAQKIPQLVFTADRRGQPDWFSERWHDFTGLTLKESLEIDATAPIFHPDDHAIMADCWQRSLAIGEGFRFEGRVRRRDGQWRWMLMRAVPMRDEDGSVMKWFGTYTDIHDSVLSRELAEQTKEQLLRVIETAEVTLWSIDMDRRITMLEGALSWRNPDGQFLTPKEIFGRDMFEILEWSSSSRTQDQEFYRTPITRILGGVSTDETRELRTAEGRCYRARYLPLRRTVRKDGVDEEVVDGCIGVLIDITELRSRETELQKQEKENSKLVAKALAAKEASRMKSQFLANMSHEIRTPIAGVIGLSELLLDTNLDVEQKETAENIQRSANALLTVINDILDFSKVESGRLDIEEVQFSLTAVLKDINKMLSFTAIRKNLAYETSIGPEIDKDLRVIGDPGRLRQILTNLLTNSIKFTSEGSVKLSVRVKQSDQQQVVVSFVVEDTGIGMDEEVRKKLFKPFSQADSSTARRYGGTGLGLTICKNLVDLMRGGITMKSQIGVGTKAEFWIPFKKAEALPGFPLVDLDSIPYSTIEPSVTGSSMSGGIATPPTLRGTKAKDKVMHASPLVAVETVQDSLEEPGLHLSADERRKIKVLVVEDNPINQQIALKTVQKYDFQATAVWNGKEALEYLMEKVEQSDLPDIVLMDVQMPILDGYKATQMIRHSQPYASNLNLRNIPIVAMTASAIRGDKEKCQKAGMDDYLAKPVKGKILENMLIKWANEGRRRRENGFTIATSHHPSLSSGGTATSMADAGIESSRASSPSRQECYEPDSLAGSSLAEDEERPISPPAPDSKLVVTVSQQTQLEEQAILLRDQKLMNAFEGPMHHSLESSPVYTREDIESTSQPITEENVAQLQDQRDHNLLSVNKLTTGAKTASSSIIVETKSK